MKKHLLGVAALLSGLAVPALAADWDHVADVTVTDNPEVQTHWVHFAGPIDGIRFDTDRAVSCSSVDITTGDGQMRTVFSGTINRTDDHVVSIPGSDVESIAFDCHPLDEPAANIDVAAVAAPGGTVVERDQVVEVDRAWVGLGHEYFRPVPEMKRVFIGGDGVSDIGIEPRDADADCYRGLAILDNGDARPLDVDIVGRLHRNRIYHFEMPDRPNVRSVQLECRAANGSIVSLNFYADQEVRG